MVCNSSTVFSNIKINILTTLGNDMLKKTVILSSIISVIVLTGIALGVYFGVFYEPAEDDNEDISLTIIGNDQTANFTVDEVKALESYTGYGGTKNEVGSLRNYNQYIGTTFLALLAEIGGMTTDHILRVTASDGYTQDYTYPMVHGNVTTFDNETGDDLGINTLNMVLIYEIVGEGPIDSGPFKVAFLSPEGYLTESILWVKYVVKLELILY